MTSGIKTRIHFSSGEVVKFLEGATRNWSHVPPLSHSNLEDVAEEMARLVEKHTSPASGSHLRGEE